MANQLASETHNGQSSNYTHDLTGQLTAADHQTQTDESYTYDANGNRIGGGHVVGPNNQILADATFNYAYDAEGNLVRQTNRSTGEFTQFEFDHRQRMVHATTKSTGGIILKEATYTYDVFDRRIAKTVDLDGAGPQAPTTTRFVYDGNHVWADLNATGQILVRYLHGAGTDELLARWRPGDGTAWYLTDHLGTVRDITNAAGLTVINHLDYDSFGNIVLQTNAGAGDRFTFTGREYDNETGLYYYRARYYSPTLGRFISQDPRSFAAGDANLYRYVFNSPLNSTDPTGELAIVEYVVKLSRGALGTLLANNFYGCVARELVVFGIGKGIGYGITGHAEVDGNDAVSLTIGAVGCAFLPTARFNQAIFLLVAESLHLAVMVSMGDAGWTDAGLLVVQHYIGIRGGVGTGAFEAVAQSKVGRTIKKFLKEDSGGQPIPGKPGGGNPYASKGAQDKLSKSRAKQLEELMTKDGTNIHDFKGKGGGKRDFFVDKETGDIYLKPKDGSGPGEWSGYNVSDFE